MIIGCDCDGIVANLHGPWLKWINRGEDPEDQIILDDIKEYDMSKATKMGRKVFDFINIPRMYQHLSPIKGALWGVKELRKMGDFTFVTAGAKEEATAADKLVWIKKWFDLPRQDVAIMHKKHHFAADIFIDDSPEKLTLFRERWPRAHTITIDYPFNRGVPVSFRADGYKNPEQAWEQIVDYVSSLKLA